MMMRNCSGQLNYAKVREFFRSSLERKKAATHIAAFFLLPEFEDYSKTGRQGWLIVPPVNELILCIHWRQIGAGLQSQHHAKADSIKKPEWRIPQAGNKGKAVIGLAF